MRQALRRNLLQLGPCCGREQLHDASATRSQAVDEAQILLRRPVEAQADLTLQARQRSWQREGRTVNDCQAFYLLRCTASSPRFHRARTQSSCRDQTRHRGTSPQTPPAARGRWLTGAACTRQDGGGLKARRRRSGGRASGGAATRLSVRSSCSAMHSQTPGGIASSVACLEARVEARVAIVGCEVRRAGLGLTGRWRVAQAGPPGPRPSPKACRPRCAVRGGGGAWVAARRAIACCWRAAQTRQGAAPPQLLRVGKPCSEVCQAQGRGRRRCHTAALLAPGSAARSPAPPTLEPLQCSGSRECASSSIQGWHTTGAGPGRQSTSGGSTASAASNAISKQACSTAVPSTRSHGLAAARPCRRLRPAGSATVQAAHRLLGGRQQVGGSRWAAAGRPECRAGSARRRPATKPQRAQRCRWSQPTRQRTCTAASRAAASCGPASPPPGAPQRPQRAAPPPAPP